MNRIGPKMQRAINIVRNTPGCTKKFVAEQITPCPVPSGNWAYGYEPVNRAIRAGYIRAEYSGRAYKLHAARSGSETPHFGSSCGPGTGYTSSHAG